MTKLTVSPSAELATTRDALEALANPTRQRILALLFEEGRGLPYNEIAVRLGFKEAAFIDQHLKRLAAELLVGNTLKRIDGRVRSVYYITDWGKEWMGRLKLDEPGMVRLLIHGAPA